MRRRNVQYSNDSELGREKKRKTTSRFWDYRLVFIFGFICIIFFYVFHAFSIRTKPTLVIAVDQKFEATTTQSRPKTLPTKETIFHSFTYSSDEEFIVIDRYLVNINGTNTVVVLGDGTIPHQIKEKEKKVTSLFVLGKDKQNKSEELSTGVTKTVHNFFLFFLLFFHGQTMNKRVL